jgi:hypothetical protein
MLLAPAALSRETFGMERITELAAAGVAADPPSAMTTSGATIAGSPGSGSMISASQA